MNMTSPCLIALFIAASGDHGILHSFPTRRSSDLDRAGEELLRREDAVIVDGAEPALGRVACFERELPRSRDRKSTRLNSSHVEISYAVFCLKKKKKKKTKKEHV